MHYSGLPRARYGGTLEVAQEVKNRLLNKNAYRKKRGAALRVYKKKVVSLDVSEKNGEANGKSERGYRENNLRRAIREKSKEPAVAVSCLPLTEIEMVIAPYRDVIKRMGSINVVDELIETLSNYLDVPSLYTGPGKKYETETENASFFPQFYEALKKVSLFDHTCNVLRNAIEIVQQTYGSGYENLMPMTVTSALAHDIGKIPDIHHNNPLRQHGHGSTSADYLKTLFDGEGFSWLETALTAVYRHHVGSNANIFVGVLMEADARARTMEIVAQEPSFKHKPLKEWLDPFELAKMMLPDINILKKRRWQAITYRGNVYCMYGHVLKSLMKLSLEKHIIDYRLVRRTTEEYIEVLGEVVDILRDSGHLGWNITGGHYYQRFRVSVNSGNISDKEFNLIPIKIDVFDVVPSDIESRKAGYIKLINGVYPVGSKNL